MSLNFPQEGEDAEKIRLAAEFQIGEPIFWEPNRGIFLDTGVRSLDQPYRLEIQDIGLDHSHVGAPHLDSCYRRERLTYDVIAITKEGAVLFRARLHASEFASPKKPCHMSNDGPNWKASHAISDQVAEDLIEALDHFGVIRLGAIARVKVAEYIGQKRGTHPLRVDSRLPQDFEWWEPR